MKVQCQCGAKYAIDVTPEMAHSPVRFVCPGCGLDLSGPINDLVRQELGLAPAPQSVPTAQAIPTAQPLPVAQAIPKATPAPAAPPAPGATPHAKSTAMRVSIPPRQAAPEQASPAKLSISKSASAATHGTAVETAPPPGGSPDGGQPCPRHQGEFTVEHCYVCRKPICPKCMELFGYVCSPLCRAKAESHGINVPVFAGQKSVIEAQQWRKISRISAAVGAVLVVFLGVWFWYAWFGSVPHPIFSAVFPARSYAGSSRITDNNQLIFLHGGLLARYKLGSKTAIWTNEIITQAQMDAEVDRQMAQAQARINDAARRGVDSEFRPRVPLREDLAKEVQMEMESSLQLFVQDHNIWIAREGKMTRYDWDTGKAGQEITLPHGAYQAKLDGSDLQFTEENPFGQHIVTHVSLTSGESHSDQFGDPRPSAVLAMERKPRTMAANNKKPGAAAGLPTQPSTTNVDQPMDPNTVAEQAQNLPYAAKLALPATLSNTRHQEQILKELKQDEAPGESPTPATSAASTGPKLDLLTRSFVDSPYGYFEWSTKVLEQKSVSHKAMKDAPTRSALENNPSVTNTAAVANEILNEMQRERGGDTVTEDVSRYQVIVHRPDEKDVPDWVGEVIGPPSVIPQKTVTVVAGGKSFVVLDKSNKKLWEASLSQQMAEGSGFDNSDPTLPSIGLGPCVEHDNTLYVLDQATVTAFDLANGNVRWRVPTIGSAGIFFDDLGYAYVNSTTADLESLRYSRQIDINKKISPSVLRIDCKTGKVLWNVQPGGFVSHVDGKFVFCFASHQAPDLDPDSLTTLPGMADSLMDVRRLDPKTGKVVWDYPERRAPLFVRFNGNIIQLVFRKEVEVLKFITL